jgi:Fuc2NAc and GlcNAc transferase
MKWLSVALTVVGAFAVALLLTAQFRRYALAKGLLDVPNARSSHEQPTPRGGGIAIVIAALLALSVLAALGIVSSRVATGLLTAGTIAAIIGYLDDRYQVPLLLRLVAQFAAAGCVVWFMNVAPVTSALGLPAGAKPLVVVLSLLYVVWMLNLTNFMDGIDGIASTEVVTVCSGIAACLNAATTASSSSQQSELFACLLVIASATAGFLRWNWPPARIFMGDAGSGFLGVMLAALTLIATAIHPALFWSCLILGGVFIVDATVTLFRRIAHGATFYHAHRSHAYQHAAQRWGHKRITVAIALINLGWLLPWAVVTASGNMHGAVAMVVAYIPLLAVAIRLRAGVET